jgi:hypothetical protein
MDPVRSIQREIFLSTNERVKCALLLEPGRHFPPVSERTACAFSYWTRQTFSANQRTACVLLIETLSANQWERGRNCLSEQDVYFLPTKEKATCVRQPEPGRHFKKTNERATSKSQTDAVCRRMRKQRKVLCRSQAGPSRNHQKAGLTTVSVSKASLQLFASQWEADRARKDTFRSANLYKKDTYRYVLSIKQPRAWTYVFT